MVAEFIVVDAVSMSCGILYSKDVPMSCHSDHSVSPSALSRTAYPITSVTAAHETRVVSCPRVSTSTGGLDAVVKTSKGISTAVSVPPTFVAIISIVPLASTPVLMLAPTSLSVSGILPSITPKNLLPVFISISYK